MDVDRNAKNNQQPLRLFICQFYYTTHLCVFSPGRCIWSLACKLFMFSFQDTTHSQSPLPLKLSKVHQREAVLFGLSEMSLNCFLMTEWSELLHQLNSIWPSLKDPVKLAHISGDCHPFPARAAHEPKAAQPTGDC